MTAGREDRTAGALGQRVLSFKTAASVGAVGAGPSMACAAAVLVQSGGVPAVVGVLFVGLTGLFVAGLLAALLVLLSWVVRRSQRGAAQRLAVNSC